MIGNNPAGNRQTQSGSVLAGGKVGREQSLSIVFRDSAAGVGNSQSRHRIIARQFAVDLQFLCLFLRRALQRIVDQIDRARASSAVESMRTGGSHPGTLTLTLYSLRRSS